MENLILIGVEFYKKKAGLEKISVDNEKWQVYYVDEVTGEKRVEEYPFSCGHGGGPPQLRLIEEFPQKVKF